jgi:hypothetical protein
MVLSVVVCTKVRIKKFGWGAETGPSATELVNQYFRWVTVNWPWERKAWKSWLQIQIQADRKKSKVILSFKEGEYERVDS